MKSFIGKISNADLYIGQNAGNRIEKHISSAKKSIKIISPYIVDKMVQLLIDKKSQGINVELLTSDDNRHFSNPEYSNILRKVIIQNRHVNEKNQKIRKWILLTFWIIALACVSTAIVVLKLEKVMEVFSNQYILNTVLTILSVEIALIIVRRKVRVFTYTYRTPFPLTFVVDPMNMSQNDRQIHSNNAFFHVKLFIIDDEIAFVGSVNLTTKGMYYNVESCLTIEDKNEVQKLSEYFDQLFNMMYYQKDLAYYGGIIFKEPIN